LVSSLYKTLDKIEEIILKAFDGKINVDYIRDNFVQIILMLDQFLLNGVPLFEEETVLSGLINPYDYTDKITEKIIGKAKDYDVKTLGNFVRDSQVNYENYIYTDENQYSEYRILFDFIDYVDMVCDR